MQVCAYMLMCAGFCMSTRIYTYILFYVSTFCIRTMCTSFPLHVHISKTNKRFDHTKKIPRFSVFGNRHKNSR